MQQLADDVWHLSGFPPNGVNVYVIGDVLIDAGMRLDRGRILKQVDGRGIARARAHARAPRPLRREPRGLRAARDPAVVRRRRRRGRRARQDGLEGRAHDPRAARRTRSPDALREGDEVAGFTVLETPGHSPGHVSYWRESDRTLLCGDVMWGCTRSCCAARSASRSTIAQPDPALNRESARRIAALEPALVCFGHGPPLRDPAKLPRRSRSCRAEARRSSAPAGQHGDRRGALAEAQRAERVGRDGNAAAAPAAPGSAAARTCRSASRCAGRSRARRARCRRAAAAPAPCRDRASRRPRRRRPRARARPRRPSCAGRGGSSAAPARRSRARRRARACRRCVPSACASPFQSWRWYCASARDDRRRSRARARTAPPSSAGPSARRVAGRRSRRASAASSGISAGSRLRVLR